MVLAKFHAVHKKRFLRHFHLAVALEKHLELRGDVEPWPQIGVFKVQAHKAGGHIVFQPLFLRFSVLLPAGNDLFDLQFDSALNLNRVKQRLIVLTLFVDGNQSVFAGASACLCESLVRLRYFARGKRGASDGVVPLDLEWT